MNRKDIKVGKVYNVVYFENTKKVDPNTDYVGPARCTEKPTKSGLGYFRFIDGFGQPILLLASDVKGPTDLE